jgi:endonuclease/exonuclease/phosphatase (EEP) superfamily protein YafD
MKWRDFLIPKPAPLLARAAILTGLFPILGLFASRWWLLDLFNHFQWQYFFTLILLGVVLLVLKSYRLAALAGVMLILPLARIAPTCRNPGTDPGGASLRVATFNVLSANKRHDEALHWIRKTDPDLIFLPEVDPVWAVALKPLSGSHPHVIEHIVEGNFGFALYSKFPILEHRIEPCGQMELPLLVAKISSPKGNFTLFGAHPVPPSSEFWSSERDAFLNEIVRHTRTISDPIVLLGDLNATRWSHGMRPLYQNGWIDSSDGHGAPPTWMNANPLISIPIDHVMFRPTSNQSIYCRHRWIGPDLGSDHRAVVAEIIW